MSDDANPLPLPAPPERFSLETHHHTSPQNRHHFNQSWEAGIEEDEHLEVEGNEGDSDEREDDEHSEVEGDEGIDVKREDDEHSESEGDEGDNVESEDDGLMEVEGGLMEVEGVGNNEDTDFDHGHMELKGDDQDHYSDSSGYGRLHNSLLNEIRGCEEAQRDLVSDDEGDGDAAFELENESLGADVAYANNGGGDGVAEEQSVGGGEEATGISPQGGDVAVQQSVGGDRGGEIRDEAGDADWFLSIVGGHGLGADGVESWLEGHGKGYEHLPGGMNDGAGDRFTHIDLGVNNVPDSSDGGGGNGFMHVDDGDESLPGVLDGGDLFIGGELGEGMSL
ncbi:hypothetical protein LTR17_020190 [Elasticomyces elasticus]|nr:hypothetical protein LTR17_020190 [Elasticomyces elasticus]